jgi:hypothetical protein
MFNKCSFQFNPNGKENISNSLNHSLKYNLHHLNDSQLIWYLNTSQLEKQFKELSLESFRIYYVGLKKISGKELRFQY